MPAPARPSHLPSDIHWLSGEGCGSWFHIQLSDDWFAISRFSPEGKFECAGLFEQISGDPINLEVDFAFTYLSHCAEVNIIQKDQQMKFKQARRC